MDQPYPLVYRAFGRLRHELGRMADERPAYPYTFASSDFVHGDGAGRERREGEAAAPAA